MGGKGGGGGGGVVGLLGFDEPLLAFLLEMFHAPKNFSPPLTDCASIHYFYGEGSPYV